MGTHSAALLDQKYIEMLKLLNIYLNHFPKHEKYALCSRIRNTAYGLYDLITETQKRYHKKTAQNRRKACMYMTATHQSPPSHITHNGKRWPVATLIANADRATLAELGIYWHSTSNAEAPLGYTDWLLVGNTYFREPAGTVEERQAAIDAAAAAQREAYLDALECTAIQGELALDQAGKYELYQSAVNAVLPNLTNTQKIFLKAPNWRYRDPVLQLFANTIGLTDEEVIQLIELAKTI